MIFLYFVLFLFSFFIADTIIIRVRLRVKKYAHIEVVGENIIFYSTSQHKLKIDGAKWIIGGNIIHVFVGGRMVRISGVTRAFENNNYLYFMGTGEINFYSKIWCIEYLKLDINSKILNVNKYKSLALVELIENLYNVDRCENLKKFLKIIKNTLKIRIFNGKITIFQNNFRFPYILTYKTINKTKKIFVNID